MWRHQTHIQKEITNVESLDLFASLAEAQEIGQIVEVHVETRVPFAFHRALGDFDNHPEGLLYLVFIHAKAQGICTDTSIKTLLFSMPCLFLVFFTFLSSIVFWVGLHY